MKKSPSPKASRNLDKHLFEAGQQCQKRLWLDYHEPVESEPGSSRRAMSAVGQQLLALARSAFPKGVQIEGKTLAKAAEETKVKLAEGAAVLFGAAFVADGVEASSDILVQNKDGALDLYEIKSGTKIKHRYVNDLALQVHVVEACGHKVRASFLLHCNPKYAHKAGTDFPAMQLLRSADVTAKVQKQVDQVRIRLRHYKKALADDSVLQLPMGTFCTTPFPCPHLARCGKEAPALPLRELPELTRALELELHKEGIEDLTALDAKRPGLSFKQRRTLQCIQQGEPIVEPFVREELRQCAHPLHLLALATLAEALPRFDGQRPWRQMPYAWACNTLHEDGRVETAAFAHADRTDPRSDFVTTLAKHLEIGGTIFCWNDDPLVDLRELLEDLPAAKVVLRTVLGRPHVDMMKLLDAGVFHPQLRGHSDIRASVRALLGDRSGDDLAVQDEDQLRELLDKAGAPRIRSTTKEKIAAEIRAAVEWQSQQLVKLFRKFAEVEEQRPRPAAPAARSAAKSLPKPLPNN